MFGISSIYKHLGCLNIWFKYLTYKRFVNLIKLSFSYFISIFGYQKSSGLSPYFISVEASNYCNLHCPECPVGTRTDKSFENKNFDLISFKNLIDTNKQTLLHVILYFQGEPFLNKNLLKLVEYAHKSHIFTSTSTNGQLLSKKNAKDIVLSGLDKLIISIDGTTQEVYEKYRMGGSLEKALNGIRELVYWKEQLKCVTPLLEIQFIVFKTNEHQMEEIKQLAKELKVDRLKFKTAQLYDFEHGNALLTSLKKYARYKKSKNGNYVIKSKLQNHCQRLWTGGVVNAKGEVLPCCFDKKSEFSFGNINDKSLAECWAGQKASDFREAILQNRKQFEMCRNCTSK